MLTFVEVLGLGISSSLTSDSAGGARGNGLFSNSLVYLLLGDVKEFWAVAFCQSLRLKFSIVGLTLAGAVPGRLRDYQFCR